METAWRTLIVELSLIRTLVRIYCRSNLVVQHYYEESSVMASEHVCWSWWCRIAGLRLDDCWRLVGGIENELRYPHNVSACTLWRCTIPSQLIIVPPTESEREKQNISLWALSAVPTFHNNRPSSCNRNRLFRLFTHLLLRSPYPCLLRKRCCIRFLFYCTPGSWWLRFECVTVLYALVPLFSTTT